MSELREGDHIRIDYYNTEHGRYEDKGVILKMPKGEGDTMHVKFDNGEVSIVNPYFYGLIRIMRIDEEND